jgi:hypothetical protein
MKRGETVCIHGSSRPLECLQCQGHKPSCMLVMRYGASEWRCTCGAEKKS